MKALSRGLVLLAVVGHVGLGLGDAFARGPGAAGGSAGGGHGAAPGVAGGGHNSPAGHYGGVNGYGGQNGIGVDGHNGPGVAGPGAPHGFNFGFNPAPFAFPPPDNQFTALSSNACGFDLQLFDPGDYVDVVDRIASTSQQTQGFISACSCNTQLCVADALDKYADALDKALNPPKPAPGEAAPAPGWFAPPPPRKLPKAVRELPRIVHEAAARVRDAKTPHAAEAAVRAAVELVQKTAAKTISLMRASDPDAKAAATRSADLVADTLNSAATALMRPDSL